MEFRERLQAMQGEAAQQMEGYTPGGSYAALPDDEYQFRVKTTLDETKKTKEKAARLMINWCFVVEDGEFVGRQVWDRTIIEDNKVGLHICRDRVELLGYEWPEEDLGSLEDIIDDITKRAPRIMAKTRTKDDGQYTNTKLTVTDVLDVFGEDGTTDTATEEVQEQEVVEEKKPAKTTTPLKKKEPEPEPEPADERLEGLLNFCAAQGIDGVSVENTVEEIISAMKDAEMTFKAEELTEEEIEIITACEGEDLIIKPKPKAAPAKKGLLKKK